MCKSKSRGPDTGLVAPGSGPTTGFSSQDDFEAHFAALREHLSEVRPSFDAFCARHGFEYVRGGLGRYPRIRIERVDERTLWFDLSMGLDAQGRRFESFERDRPYELGAGACLDVRDGPKHGTRYCKSVMCFEGVPFEQVGAMLLTEMEKYLPLVGQWTAQYLRESGMKVKLGGG